MLKKSFRLGGGEFEREFIPLDADFIGHEVTRGSVEDTRDRFMKVCAEIEPRLLESLFSQDLDLINWCEQWNLKERWCLRWARRQLIKRELQEKAQAIPKPKPVRPKPVRPTGEAPAGQRRIRARKITEFVFTEFNLVGEPPPLVPLQFQSEGWRFEHDDRKTFEARMTAEFARVLSSYCDKIEKDAERSGFQRTREKRIENDFFWLARHHLKGERFADIARNSAALKYKQVQIAVHRLATLIGLPLK